MGCHLNDMHSKRRNKRLVAMGSPLLAMVVVLVICSFQDKQLIAFDASAWANEPTPNPGLLVSQRPPRREGAPGQPPGGFRDHTVTQSNRSPELRSATVPPISESQISISVEGDWRVLRSNSISEHNTGPFPNEGNPNSIREQQQTYRIAANPQLASSVTRGGWVFGVAVNGVPFDPGAGEFYRGNPRLGWQYEALSGAIDLGFDENHAHVQPEGTYHYHGLPALLLDELSVRSDRHSPLVGWAADGFPIYALYGYQNGEDMNSGVVAMTSSYRLKSGSRPGGNEPGGSYDGTFVTDYDYIDGAGLLDECNGRRTVTPEFPEGTYAYFLTSEFPVVPRCFVGIPSQDFAKGGGAPR